ncbi:MAG: hypothetical protein IKU40_03640 [Clostridia bacterium]|nr:hypothetical protein [Clostridia bacterium]
MKTTERRRIRRELRKQIRSRIYPRDADDRIIIPLTVTDDSDFLSVFSEYGTPHICADVADYLAEKTDYLPPTERLHLQIRSNCITQEEQEIYRVAIREYYMNQYIRNRRERIRNTVLSAVLAAAGLLLLVLTGFLDERFGMPIWTEAADIAAWVFVWEAVDVSVFRNYSVRIESMRSVNGIDMLVEFLPLERSCAGK